MSGQRLELNVLRHTVDIAGRVGWRERDRISTGLFVRVGYHLDMLRIDLSSVTPLPSENIAGLTLGAVLELPRMWGRLGVRLQGDALVAASREQTIGIADGTDAGTQGVLGAARLSYALAPAWTLDAGYELAYVETAFSGFSDRLQMAATGPVRANLDQV